MLAALLLALQSSPSAQQDEAQEAFFEARVRPVLVARCYECHSHAAQKLKGHLYLDSREGWKQGGDSGPAIVERDPEQSELVRAVRYTDTNLQMPPKGKLPQNEIDDLVAWVRAGAYDPRTAPPATVAAHPEAARHWAFQPVRDAVPPQVKDERWISNEIDRFVLARLEAEGLAPAPRADKRTLLRRATYDLLGLPPTPAELTDFEVDDSPQAFEHVVDRLLASPHYGERWGRRWLDLARYSDSNGLDENLAMAQAWRYRDWVVAALDRDLPYDQFLTQQLAGDLLPKPADEHALAEQLTATGFLVLGPKVLAEQDKEKLVMDVVDEEIDVTSKALLGLTVSCARCHDHKFDPWTQRDYYALAGIFKSTSTLANLDFVSRWREVELATDERKAARDAHEKLVKEAEAQVAAIVKRGEAETSERWPSELASDLLAAWSSMGTTRVIEAEDFARGNVLVDHETWGTKEDAIIRTGNGERPQFAEWEFEAEGALSIDAHYAAEDARPVKVLLDGAVLAAASLSEVTGSWFPDAQRWRPVGSRELAPGRHLLRIECGTDLPHIDAFAIQVRPASEVVAALALRLAKARARPDPVLGAWTNLGEPAESNPLAKLLLRPPPASIEELAARYQVAAIVVLDEWRAKKHKDEKATGLDDPANELLRKFLVGPDGVFTLPPGRLEASFPADLRAELAAARAARKELDARAPPPIEKALGAAEGEIVDVPVHIRGSHLNKAPSAEPRGFLSSLATVVPPPAIPEHASGRLELARWLCDPAHPLTARVMVNRIWQGHFGAGLVRTPSNFGLRGEAPTHPELLDWLARRFIDEGWSMKRMHRLVMLSSTYQMSSHADAAALERDPENRLLARMNRRRLEAEAVRDALLATSGRLDPALGGTLLAAKDGDYVTNDQSADAAQYTSTRRSLYLPVIRNAVYDLFSTFDYADPSMALEQRSSTTDPSQALLLLNSPLAVGESEACARALLAQGALDDRARLDALWQRAYQRAPREAERTRAVAFLADHLAHDSGGDARERAWSALCRALCASNEFLYVD